jgi:hypothetical protein
MMAYGVDATRLWKGNDDRLSVLLARGDAGMSEDKADHDLHGNASSTPHDDNSSKPDSIANSELASFANENANLGTALRTIYQQTVDESVPPDMLDLLNRLN